MFKFIINVKKHVCIKSLQEDLRKYGINVVTAGMIGLFITNINHLTLLLVSGALWLTFVGLVTWFLGLYRRNKS